MMLDTATPQQVRDWVGLNLKMRCASLHHEVVNLVKDTKDELCARCGGKGWLYPLMEKRHGPQHGVWCVADTADSQWFVKHPPDCHCGKCRCSGTSLIHRDWHLEDLLAAVRRLDYDMAFNLLSSSPMLNASEPADPREVLEVATLEVARLLKQQLAQEQASEPAQKRKRTV